MSSFQEEFDKRMRRVCGVTDDTLPVTHDEDLRDGSWSGDPYDTAWPAEYEITIAVHRKNGKYSMETVASKTFSRLDEFLNAVMAVEL